MLPVILATRIIKGENVATYTVLITALPAQFYYWGLWSAYCSLLTLEYVATPGTSFHWLYYITGFGSCLTPLAYLTSAESRTKESSEEVQGLMNGSILYTGLAIVAYIIFCVWPQLSFYPYAWFLRHII